MPTASEICAKSSTRSSTCSSSSRPWARRRMPLRRCSRGCRRATRPSRRSTSTPCAPTMRRSSTTCGTATRASRRSTHCSTSWSRWPPKPATRLRTPSCGTTPLSPTVNWFPRRSSPNTSITPGFRTGGSTCAAALSPSSATRMPGSTSRLRRRCSRRGLRNAGRRSSSARASSAGRRTARPRLSGAKARTIRRRLLRTSSTRSRCRCGRMSTAC